MTSLTDDDTPSTGNQNANRVSANEVTSYVRYVLENRHPTNVRLSELAARVYVDPPVAMKTPQPQ